MPVLFLCMLQSFFHTWKFFSLLFCLVSRRCPSLSQILILVGRALNIFPLSFLCNKFREHKITLKMQLVMWFSGEKHGQWNVPLCRLEFSTLSSLYGLFVVFQHISRGIVFSATQIYRHQAFLNVFWPSFETGSNETNINSVVKEKTDWEVLSCFEK